MPRWPSPLLATVALASAACGGAGASSTPARGPTAVEPAISTRATEHEPIEPAPEPVPEQAPKATSVGVPTECADPTSAICTPPKEFTERLCRQAAPEVALVMFRKGAPWTRGYIRVNADAWYAGGGMSHPSRVEVGEEVLILANRTGGAGRVQIVGSGSYDVFRWDGTCVSLMSDEVTTRRVGFPRTAIIPWRKLDPTVRDVLLRDKGIAFRNGLGDRLCKVGESDKKPCRKHHEALTQLIADYVRKGGDVPAPPLGIP